MTAQLASAIGPSAFWYLARATGVVSLLLLTTSVVLGILGPLRVTLSERWPRFAIDTVHRDVSLLVIDTVNEHGGWQGSLDRQQLAWLDAELTDLDEARRYAVLASEQCPADEADQERLVVAPMQAVFERGITSGHLRQDLPAHVLRTLFSGTIMAASKLIQHHQLGLEEASAAAAAVFLDGARAR